jgi:deazaflavin-dependent oxidoreductase (nitroreductase family)
MSRSLPRRALARVGRAAARTPILLYRARLGFLLGHRFLLLQHVGRISGLPRYVVLEVVRRQTCGRYVVVSGFGARADWFRNVRATPDVRVSVGPRRLVAARARVLSADEARQAVAAYQDEHAWRWRLVAPVIRRVLGAGADSEDGGLSTRLPFVELSLEPTRAD